MRHAPMRHRVCTYAHMCTYRRARARRAARGERSECNDVTLHGLHQLAAVAARPGSPAAGKRHGGALRKSCDVSAVEKRIPRSPWRSPRVKRRVHARDNVGARGGRLQGRRFRGKREARESLSSSLRSRHASHFSSALFVQSSSPPVRRASTIARG